MNRCFKSFMPAVVAILFAFSLIMACSGSVQSEDQKGGTEEVAGETAAEETTPETGSQDLAVDRGTADAAVAPEVDEEEVYVPVKKPYPPAPYGKVPGSVIKNHKFLDPANHNTNVELADLYNPDGALPKKVLVMNASAGWCSACKEEAIALKKKYETYADQGLEIWFTLFEDFEAKDATIAFWQDWVDMIKPNYPTLLDVDFELGSYFSIEATPMNMVIALDTMKIVYLQTGFDPVGIENAIKQNLQ